MSPRVRLPVVSEEGSPAEPQSRRGRRLRDARSRTEHVDSLPKFQLREARASVTAEELALAADRPQVRGDCAAGGPFEARPCAFVACRYNLYLDFSESGRHGSIVYNFPTSSRSRCPRTRAARSTRATRGGVTLEVVGDLLNVTRERIRQLEAKALGRLQRRRAALALREHIEDSSGDEHLGPLASIATAGGGTVSAPVEDEDGEGVETRNSLYIPGREPRMLHGDPDAEADWLLAHDIRTERERSMPTEGGIPLNPRAVQAIRFIRASWATRGRGPTLLEIADELGVVGANDAARRAATSTALQSLREAGLVEFSRTEGAKVVERRESPAEVAAPVPGTPRLRRGRPRQVARERSTAAPAPEAAHRIFLAPSEGPASVQSVPLASEPPPPDDPPAAGDARPTEDPMPKTTDAAPKISAAQGKMLDLYEKGEAPGAIATALGTTPGSVNSAIHRLRARGLVKRKAGVQGGSANAEATPAPRARPKAGARSVASSRARTPPAVSRYAPREWTPLSEQLKAKVSDRIAEIYAALAGKDALQKELATLTKTLEALG